MRCPKCGYISYFKGTSDPQRAYWFGGIIPYFMEFIGCSKDEAHEILKIYLLGYKEVEIGGQTIKIAPSIMDLSTEEMNDLISRAIALGAKLGMNIPEPQEEPKGE